MKYKLDKHRIIPKELRKPFFLVAFLFALWGFANAITDPMVQAFKKVLELSKSRGFRPIKVSEIGNYGQKELNDNNTIVVFDEVGDLINLYAVADLAIVAGSIIFNKGHNFMEPIFANTLCITGAKLNNYKQLKRDLCDTNQIETFETKNQLRALVDKYKDSNIRDKKLISQKKALEELSGSYELIIDILNDI